MTSYAEIQRAAVRTFSAAGYAATGIRDIAAAAGVTSGTLYLHAANKLAILESVMHFALDELVRVAALATEGHPPAAQLERLVRALVSVQATNPRTVSVVDGELRFLPPERRAEIVAKRDRYERYWTDALAAGVAGGDFDVDEVTLTRLALLEMCNGVAHWYQPAGPLGLDRIEDVFVQLALNLVGYAGPPVGPDPALRSRLLTCEPAEQI